MDKKPLSLLIRYEYSKDDEDFSADAGRVSMAINKDIILAGDDYHDKIDSQIEGFLKAMDFFKIPYTKKIKNVHSKYIY